MHRQIEIISVLIVQKLIFPTQHCILIREISIVINRLIKAMVRMDNIILISTLEIGAEADLKRLILLELFRVSILVL